MIDSQWFSMSGTTFTVVFSIALVSATAVFSWIAFQRTGFRKRTLLLEGLRLLLVTLVAFTINQPEWLQQFVPDEDPVLAVLWDDSGSMATQDVIDESNPSAKPLERRQWLAPMLADEIWDPYRDRVRIVMQPFSSSDTSPGNGSDLNAALGDALQRHNNLRGVVMFSDGSWNQGDSPTEAATRLRLKDVPVYTVAVGSDTALPDIEIASLDAPTFGVVNKPTRIPFSIVSTMPKPVTVTASLTSSDGDELVKVIEIPAHGRLEDALTWKPKTVGDYTLMLTVPPEFGELVTDNNSLSVPISIRKESLKVLVVESFPRWEYRYLRNALSRDPGIDVSCLLYHPQLNRSGGGKDYIDHFPRTMEELSAFDVIFLGDVGIGDGQLTPDDCENIRRVVESQASGLILMPGFRGKQFSLLETRLEALFPVHLDQAQLRGWASQMPSQFQLTEAGRRSLLTRLADSSEGNASVWRSLPGFQWYAPVLRAKAGTQVLAVHASDSNENGRIPLLVTKTFGVGKVLFMGTDAAWRWREGVEDKFHYRFWGQVARWMAYQRNMAGGESMRMYYSPDRPKAGRTITLNANVMSVSGEPLQQGNVNVQVIAPSGNSKLIKLNPPGDESQWGLFTNTFTPVESGEHQVIMTCRESRSTLETVISVQGTRLERIGKPANQDVLNEVAAITRGKMVTTDQIHQVFDAIESLPEPEPRLRRIRIWASPAWGAILIGLLGMFWVGRKLDGSI